MKRKMWSCMETQKHVIPFIDDQLSISDLDAFLYHMEHCPDENGFRAETAVC